MDKDSHKVYIGCCMIILHPDGNKALVSKRKKEPDLDGIQIPGGTVDYATGEHLLNAAIREAEEETGIRVKDPKFLCAMNTFYYGKERPLHVAFVGRSESAEIPRNPEPHKAEDWYWQDLENLPEGKWFRMSKRALEFYKEHLNNSETDRFVLDDEFLNI